MKNILSKLALLSFLMASPMLLQAKERIVVLSEEVGDVVVALGKADEVVGKNKFNKSKELANAPEVGLHRNVAIEAVLERNPTVVIGSHDTMPATIFDALNQKGVKAVNAFPKGDLETFLKGVETIGELVGEPEKGKELAKKWREELKPLKATGKKYILSYDGNFVAGKGTPSDELIKLAGGINGADFEGLRPMNREAWIESDPDVIILANHNESIVGGLEGFGKRPEIKGTKAFKNKKIFFWPVYDYFGFSPKTVEVVKKLHDLAED